MFDHAVSLDRFTKAEKKLIAKFIKGKIKTTGGFVLDGCVDAIQPDAKSMA